MYQPMLFLHWKQIRFALIPLILGAYALPLLSVQGLGIPGDGMQLDYTAYRILDTTGFWLGLHPILAMAVGIVLGLSAWNWDHQLRHVYALSLPISRRSYALSKMGAGALLAMLPVAGFWIGAHLASASISLPTGLNAYPNALAVRFGLAVLVAYSVAFAFASGTIRTAGWLFTAFAAFIVVGVATIDFMATVHPMFLATTVPEIVFEWMASAGGPLRVFTGSWALIDV